jgi:hypothetical protein
VIVCSVVAYIKDYAFWFYTVSALVAFVYSCKKWVDTRPSPEKRPDFPRIHFFHDKSNLYKSIAASVPMEQINLRREMEYAIKLTGHDIFTRDVRERWRILQEGLRSYKTMIMVVQYPLYWAQVQSVTEAALATGNSLQ